MSTPQRRGTPCNPPHSARATGSPRWSSWPTRSSTSWSSAAAWSARAPRWTPPPAACPSRWSRRATGPPGTSSRSSKLIHGGLRYLEQRDFGLVREALTERGLLLNRIAPHLVRPVPFLLPLRHRVWERAYIGAGVLLYDTARAGAAGAAPAPAPDRRRAALRKAPGPAPGRARRRDPVLRRAGGRRALHDDARAHRGAVRRAGRHPDQGHRPAARGRPGRRRAWSRDLESGRSIDDPGTRVISATGVWTDDLQRAGAAPKGVSGARVQGRAPGGARGTGSTWTPA